MLLRVSVNTLVLLWPLRVGGPRNIGIRGGWGITAGNGLSWLLAQIVFGFAFAFVARSCHCLTEPTYYAAIANVFAMSHDCGINTDNGLAISGIAIRLYTMELPQWVLEWIRVYLTHRETEQFLLIALYRLGWSLPLWRLLGAAFLVNGFVLGWAIPHIGILCI